jgi:hypothetical protein
MWTLVAAVRRPTMTAYAEQMGQQADDGGHPTTDR